MKQFLVDSNLWCCHGNAFVKKCLGKICSFFVKKMPFLTQKVFLSNFIVEIRNPHLKIDPCAKFQPDMSKDKGSSNFQILTWNDTKNCLMTSYLLHSDDVINIIISFVRFFPEYHHAKFGGNWTKNKGTKEWGSKRPQPE